MKKLVALVAFVAIMFSAQAFSQNITAQTIYLPLSSTPQPPTMSGPPSVVGQPGSSTYYFWFVSNFTVGNSSPSAVGAPCFNAPQTLTSGNYCFVSWNKVLDANSYDVLMTTTPTQPSGACNCAVVTGTSNSSLNVQSNTLNSYTVTTLNPLSLLGTIDNEPTGARTSAITLRIGGIVQSLGGAIGFAGVPSGPCTSLQNAVNTLTGDYYSCNGGAWLKVGPGAAGSAAWNTVTAGTNLGQALIVGNGSSLTAVGSGVISATQSPWSGLTGTLAAGGDLGSTYPNPTVLITHLSAPLPVLQGGTGTTTPGLIAGTNITSITGTWPNQTINASGAATAFQANAVALTSSATVNFQNSAAFNGLTATFTNPSAGNVQLGFSGTLGNAGLTNSSITVTTAAPLGGAGTISLGGTLALTCPTCLASSLLTTNGDIIAQISGSAARLAQGGNGTFLGVSGGLLGYYTPAGSGTINAALQFAFPYYSAAGSATTISGVPGPTTNGTCVWNDPVIAGAAVQPVCTLQGIAVNAQSGGTYPLVYSDRAAYIKESGGTTATLTLPQVTGNTAANMPFVTQNLNSGLLTLTANAADKIDNSATGGSSTVLSNFAVWTFQDSSSVPGNWWTLKVPTFAAFGSTCANALTWSTTTGFGCSGALGGAVSSVSNSDGTLTISPTTGAVVASIALGHANTWSGLQTFSAPCGSGTAGCIVLPQGTAQGHATANAIVVEAPSSVTAYEEVLPGSAATGIVYGTAAAGVETDAFKSLIDLTPTDYIAGGGTAQAQTATFSPAATTLTNGLLVRWLPVAANTAAAPTLAVNGLAAKPITKLGTSALVANDLTTTAIAIAIYDGTEFQLQNPQVTSGSGTVTSVTFTGDGTVLSSTPSSAVTTSGTVAASLATAPANDVLGNFTGSTAAPTYGKVTSAQVDSSIAPIASPTFTGTPAAPTAALGTNTTQLATTAFVTCEAGLQTSIPSSDTLSAAGTFATTISVPNTCLAVGTLLEIRAHGVYTTTATASPKIAMQVNAGGTTGICPAATNQPGAALNVTSGPWEAVCYVQINTTGVSGTSIAWGTFMLGPTSGSTATSLLSLFSNISTVTYNTSASQTVSIQEGATFVSGQTVALQSVSVRVLSSH